MLRAILFDFNGVLVDDEPLHFELFQQVLGEEGLELSREDYYAHYLGYDDRGCFAAVFEAAGVSLTPDRLSRLIARKASYYLLRIRQQGFPFFPGAVELVKAAVASPLRVGVVSGALRDEIEGALQQIGVLDAFQIIVSAEDVQESKPDPEGYRRGVELLNSLPPLPPRLFHPHEVLAIEDSPAGLEAAAGAGLTTLGVAQTYPAARLAAAEQTVDSLAGLTLVDLRQLFASRS